MKEKWKTITDFPKYEASSFGRIRNAKTTRIRKVFPAKGYLRVNLRRRNQTIFVYVHCLVMSAFVGEKPQGHQVNHKNGIKTDNRLENLEYATRVENMQHAKNILGWVPQKTIHYVSDDALQQAKQLKTKGISWQEIALNLGFNKHIIYRAYRRSIKLEIPE